MDNEVEARAFIALAAMCEAASGPDRELDARIAAALEISPARFDRSAFIVPLEWKANEDGRVEIRTVLGENSRKACGFDAPAYTASIDAAMTLVPEGSVWLRKSPETMSIYTPPKTEKLWATHIDGKGATPALALCAAAIRALAAPPPHGGA